MTNDALEFQRYVWDFKAGLHQEWAIGAVANVLNKLGYNGQTNPNLVLACIPASTVAANHRRYHDFSGELCKRINVQDGFAHIKIVQEKAPKHISGVETEEVLSFDREFFAGKDVIVFDDVVTKGRSMLRFMRKLREVNARPVICCSLGMTLFPSQTFLNPINPYTAKPIFELMPAPYW